MRVSQELVERYYPEDAFDGTRAFYDWVRSTTTPDTVMLNLGAGQSTGRTSRSFRGEVRRVFGADIDPAVMRNESLDEALIIRDGRIPLPDSSIDVCVSDYVFEHVEDPAGFMREAFRVLKRGGSFFFRTPNKFHYVALGARLTPHFLHTILSSWMRGVSEEEIFPTFYRLNTRRAIERAARDAGFCTIELRFVETEPSYLMFARMPFFAGLAYERIVNRCGALAGLRADIFGRLGK